MPYSCAVTTCANTTRSGARLSFHRLPVREPARLRLWLCALGVDADTPRDELRKRIVCSEHFAPEDYAASGQPRGGAKHRFLRATAVPSVGVSPRAPPPGAEEEDSSSSRSERTLLDPHPSADTQMPPSLLDVKVEQVPAPEERRPQVKEEQEVLRAKARTSDSGDVSRVKSEPSPSAVDGGANERWSESDGSVSPHGIEVFVGLEQPAREEKCCHVCGKSFRKDSYLIRHVGRSHKGRKAFKCLKCNKEFVQRHQLILHIRSHTGEKPFSCEHCGKTFVQNSTRLAHLRVHTGEKPYFCAKCGKSFATSNHFKFCVPQSEREVAPARASAGEKAFKCSRCDKEFEKSHQLVRHGRVHTGERPFGCDVCGKTFTQNSSRTVHMRQHTGEKPFFCDKCGRSFASGHHLKLCTGAPPKNGEKPFRCATCGRSFHTDTKLKVHLAVHESWQRHIGEKLQEQELDRKKLKAA